MVLEGLVQQRPDLFRVADRRYAAYFLARVFQDEVRGGAADLAGAQLCGDLPDVHFRRAAGQDQQGSTVEFEHQAVGDGRDVAAQRGGRGGRRRDLVLEDRDGVLAPAAVRARFTLATGSGRISAPRQ